MKQDGIIRRVNGSGGDWQDSAFVLRVFGNQLEHWPL